MQQAVIHRVMTEQLFNALKAIETLASGTMKLRRGPYHSGGPGPGPRADYKPSQCPQLRLLLLKYIILFVLNRPYHFISQSIILYQFLKTSIRILEYEQTDKTTKTSTSRKSLSTVIQTVHILPIQNGVLLTICFM